MSSPPTLLEAKPNPAAYFNASAGIYDRMAGGAPEELMRSVLHLPQIQLTADSVILDNACGAGAVMQRIVRSRGDKPVPKITCVDLGPNLVNVARAKAAAMPAAASDQISFGVMDAERLEFGDDTFTHSFTSLAIPFFNDPVAGVREIRRTLQPGGLAVITSWADIGFLSGIIHPAQRAVRPDHPLFQMPTGPKWEDPAYLEQVVREGGFEDVELVEIRAQRSEASLEGCVEAFVAMVTQFSKDWSEGDREALEAAVRENTEKVAKPHTLIDGSAGFGVDMGGVIVIARK